MKISEFWHKYILQNKKLIGKSVAIFFVFVISFGASMEIFSNYFFAKHTKDLYATLINKYPVDYSPFKPFRKWEIEPPELSAKSAIVVEFVNGESKILFGKNQNKILPIASLSKVFSSYTALQLLPSDLTIAISEEALKAPTNTGLYQVGDKFLLKDLLYSVLVESSNDAIYAIALQKGIDNFVYLMNKEIQKIGLQKTHFVDPIGLDPDFPYQGYNYSTAKEIAKFAQFLLSRKDADPKTKLLLDIMGAKEFLLYQTNGHFHHQVYTTNKLLDNPKFQKIIIAGKTGYTPLAGECFLLITKHPKYPEGYLIIVILGSHNRFKEAEELINWINNAFIW